MDATKQTTLCFLTRNSSVLLAMKKRGFGKGKWNGTGGKLERSETPEEAAIRETEEEIGVHPLTLEQVAEISFSFPPERQDWNQRCHVFLCKDWSGTPQESEEMAPTWFRTDSLPLADMWPDDPLWLPQALAGKKFRAEFSFDSDQRMLPDFRVQEVTGFIS